jgi:hypothetical protein
MGGFTNNRGDRGEGRREKGEAKITTEARKLEARRNGETKDK